MYHVRRADNQDERSLYKGDLSGFDAACVEAGFRTYHTGVPHEVYDDVHDRVETTVVPSAYRVNKGYTSANVIRHEHSNKYTMRLMTATIGCMLLVIVTLAYLLAHRWG